MQEKIKKNAGGRAGIPPKSQKKNQHIVENDVTAKCYTPHGATSALDAYRAGRHLWRPYGGRSEGVAYDANMPDGTRE